MVASSIINKSKLPDVLSDDEFNYYFKQFSEGNLDVLDILVIHNLRLVYWYVDNNINCEELDYNEVISVGIEALIESFYSFDTSRDIKFSTYATICIRNKILKYLRTENKYRDKFISLDIPMFDSDNAATFGEILVDDSINFEEDVIEKDLNIYFKKEIALILDNLNDVDRKIIMLYFGFYDRRIYVQREICEMLGLSQSYVSKRLSRTLKRIREMLEESLEYDISKEMSLVKKAA